MFKKAKMLVALALISIMCVMGATAAYAVPGVIQNEDGSPVEAYITKFFEMPDGTDVPAANFKFTVTPVSVDDLTDNSSKDSMPKLGNGGVVEISYAGGEDNSENGSGNNMVFYPKQSDSLFNGVTFPHAGEYVYSIEEVADTYIIADSNQESMDYSSAKYTLHVYVVEDTGNAGSYFVHQVSAVIDAADAANTDSVGTKVDPTQTGEGATSADMSKLVFTNSYLRTYGPTNPDKPEPNTDATLSVSKTVTGTYASTTEYFSFKLTVNAPGNMPDDTTFKAYVLDNGNPVGSSVLTAAANNDLNLTVGTDGEGHNYVVVKSGEEVDFRLKHQEKLAFIDTPVGTSYDVTESAANAYTASVEVYTNGDSKKYTAAGASMDFGQDNNKVGIAKNSAEFLNTREDITATGLNLNDLPFIGLIVFGGLLVMALAVFKFRRKAAGEKSEE